MLYRIIYNSDTAQVFLTFKREFLVHYKTYAKAVELSCRTRMLRAVKDREVVGFIYHGYLLKRLAAKVRHDPACVNDKDMLYLTLAEGYHIPANLKFKKRHWFSRRITLGHLDLGPDDSIAFDHGGMQLNYIVTYLCKQLNITPVKAHYAHLQAMIIRAAFGETIRLPQDTVHHGHMFKELECYHINVDDAAGVAVLQIDDLKTTLGQYTPLELFRHVRSEITSLSPDYLAMDQHTFESELHLILHDKVAQVLNHPISMLLGFKQSDTTRGSFIYYNESRKMTYVRNHSWSQDLSFERQPDLEQAIGISSRSKATSEVLSQDTPKKQARAVPKFKLEVDATGVSAAIGTFTSEDYATLDVNENWLREQLAKQGFRDSRTYKLDTALIALSEYKDLSGIKVLEGIPALPFSQPYLKAVHPLSSKTDQASVVARPGEIIAVIAYKKEGQDGLDVFGQTIAAARAAMPELELGDVASLSPDGNIVARKSGLAIITPKGVTVADILEHQGDVNSNTGNIFFNGAVIINGSIEAGALVKATGPVEVRGSVAGGVVIAGGDIKVAQGIIAAKGALIRTKGDLYAEFIENSKVIVKKNVYVNKAVMNCDLYVGESIQVKDPASFLVGGRAVFGSELSVGNLGRANTPTVIRPGDQYLLCLRADILNARNERLKHARAELIKAHATAKAERELTEKKKSRFGSITEHLAKIDEIIERVTKKLEATDIERTLNQSATASVKNVLSMNVKFIFRDEVVVPVADYANVKFVMRQSKGTHFIANEDEKPGDDKEKDKEKAAS